MRINPLAVALVAFAAVVGTIFGATLVAVAAALGLVILATVWSK